MNKRKIKIIDNYFNNNLNDKDKILFNKYMSNDKEFKNSVNYEKKIRQSINKYDIKTFNKKINEIKIPKSSYNLLIFVNLFTFGLFITILLLSSINKKDIYYDFYKTENIVSSRNQKIDNNVLKSVIYYKNENYNMSIHYLEKVIEKNKNDMAAHFYMAISYMELNNFEKASYIFKHIINDENNLYIEKSRWYLSLCFIKLKDKEKAIKHLTLISEDTNNYYSNKSKKLINKLN